MNVAELRACLEGLPDHMTVAIQLGASPYLEHVSRAYTALFRGDPSSPGTGAIGIRKATVAEAEQRAYSGAALVVSPSSQHDELAAKRRRRRPRVKP